MAKVLLRGLSQCLTAWLLVLSIISNISRSLGSEHGSVWGAGVNRAVVPHQWPVPTRGAAMHVFLRSPFFLSEHLSGSSQM